VQQCKRHVTIRDAARPGTILVTTKHLTGDITLLHELRLTLDLDVIHYPVCIVFDSNPLGQNREI